jgi:DNA polymerase I
LSKQGVKSKEAKLVIHSSIDYSKCSTMINHPKNFLLYSKTDGKIHPSWHTLGAQTSRMSMSEPQMHNVHTNDRSRRCVVAEPDHVFVTMDLKGIEFRVIAALAEERRVVETIRAGKDVHVLTSELVYGNKNHRRQSKTLNYALLYLGSPTVIIREFAEEGIDIHMDEAKILYSKWHLAYPSIREYHHKMREIPVIKTPIYNRILKPSISTHGNEVVVGKDNVNYLVQSVARDILVDCAFAFQDKGFGSTICMMIHDEILCMVPVEMVDKVEQALKEVSTRVFHPPDGIAVPIEGEVSVLGPIWKCK